MLTFHSAQLPSMQQIVVNKDICYTMGHLMRKLAQSTSVLLLDFVSRKLTPHLAHSSTKIKRHTARSFLSCAALTGTPRRSLCQTVRTARPPLPLISLGLVSHTFPHFHLAPFIVCFDFSVLGVLSRYIHMTHPTHVFMPTT